MAKILIIDDSNYILETLGKKLEESEYKVFKAATGEEGVEIAIIEKPDMAIIDTVMPGMDGYEVCKKIKNIEGQKIKVIVITGSIDAVDVARALKAGADDYCVKVQNFENLIGSMKKLLDKE